MVELGGRAQRGGRGTCDGPAGQAAAVGRRRDLRWIRAGGRREQAAAATELRPAEDKGAGSSIQQRQKYPAIPCSRLLRVRANRNGSAPKD
jgi:hypothetical protein